MKFGFSIALPLAFVAVSVAAGPNSNKAGHHVHHGFGKRAGVKQSPPPSQVPLRRARAPVQVTPRKLMENAETPRTLYQQPQPFAPLGNLLGVPRELINNFVNTSPLLQLPLGLPLSAQPVHTLRSVADTGLDTVEQIAQGVAQRSRNVLDRTATRASDLVETSVAFGSNSLEAGIDAARNLQEEAKRVAAQAAGAAHSAVMAGERALTGAFDRLATAVTAAGSVHDAPATENYGQLLKDPLSTLVDIASSGIV